MKPQLYTALVLGGFFSNSKKKKKIKENSGFSVAAALEAYAHLYFFPPGFVSPITPQVWEWKPATQSVQSNGCKIIGVLVFTQLRLFCFCIPARPVDGLAKRERWFSTIPQEPLGSSSDKDDYSIRLHVQSSYAFQSEWKWGGNHIWRRRHKIKCLNQKGKSKSSMFQQEIIYLSGGIDVEARSQGSFFINIKRENITCVPPSPKKVNFLHNQINSLFLKWKESTQ